MNRIAVNIGNRELSIEQGSVAKQSHGSAWVTYGETVVLVAVVSAEAREGIDFFPLTVDYREQTSAAGKIPGGFFKREGRPTEKEILTSRLIDRTIRPLFPEGYRREVQVSALVLSADQENDPDILSIVGASAALTASPIPFSGPVGAVRVGLREGSFVFNPTVKEMEDSRLNLVLAGTADSIIMLEGWAREVSEDTLCEAIVQGWDRIKEIVSAQMPLAAAKEEFSGGIDAEVVREIEAFLAERLPNAYGYPEKHQRSAFYATLQEEYLAAQPEDRREAASRAYAIAFERSIRKLILSSGRRFDGRGPRDIRPLASSVSVLPRPHGSAMFTRGQTQCLASVTLGSKGDEQMIDGLYEESSKRFMLHYNFPPFSVGEVAPVRGPGRREIGHGALAERSIAGLIPPEETFPYTIRVVANILECNGSSSMATVCAASLALMDAGVPLPKHVAGVALGLIIEDASRYLILTDIAGEEDHYGDLDLKIAGTEDGITGFQMDVKCCHVTPAILREAVVQSKEARLAILSSMKQTISAPRPHLSAYAPKVVSVRINPEKIGLVIGPGGKNIRSMIQRHSVDIDVIDTTGEVRIMSSDLSACERAAQEIRDLTAEPEVGKVYDGVVTRLMNFGAFVKFMPNQEGMVHISELDHQRVDTVEDAVKVGMPVKVKVIGIDELGRVNLSCKQAMTAEEIRKVKEAHRHLPRSKPQPPRSRSRPPRHRAGPRR